MEEIIFPLRNKSTKNLSLKNKKLYNNKPFELMISVFNKEYVKEKIQTNVWNICMNSQTALESHHGGGGGTQNWMLPNQSDFKKTNSLNLADNWK